MRTPGFDRENRRPKDGSAQYLTRRTPLKKKRAYIIGAVTGFDESQLSWF